MLALFLVFAHMDDVVRRARAYNQGLLNGLGKLGRGYWGMVMAHCGLAVMVAGITLVSFHEVERDIRMAPGDQASIGDYAFVFDSLDSYVGPNFDSTRGHFHVTYQGEPEAVPSMPASGATFMSPWANRWKTATPGPCVSISNRVFAGSGWVR